MRRIVFRLLIATWLSLGLTQAQDDVSPAIGVTFLQIDDATRGIMEQWPPSPLDIAVVFLNLQTQQPKIVSVVTPLAWPDLESKQLQVLQKQIAKLPVLAGMVLDANAVTSATSEDLQDFARISSEGAPETLPSFMSVANRPSEDLCLASQLGFTEIDFGPLIEFSDDGFSLSVIARSESGELLISLPLLTACKALEIDLDSIQWANDGELILTEALRLPLDAQGHLKVLWELESTLKSVTVESISPTSDDPMPVSDMLHQQCVVFGYDDDRSKQFPRDADSQVSFAHLMALTVVAILNSTEAVDDPPEASNPIIDESVPVQIEEPVATNEPEVTAHPNFGAWLLGGAMAGLLLLTLLARIGKALFGKKEKPTKEDSSSAGQ